MGGSIYLHLIPHHPKQFSVCSAPFEKAKSNDPSGFKFFQDDCDGITMLFKAFDSSSPKQIMLDHNIVHLPWQASDIERWHHSHLSSETSRMHHGWVCNACNVVLQRRLWSTTVHEMQELCCQTGRRDSRLGRWKLFSGYLLSQHHRISSDDRWRCVAIDGPFGRTAANYIEKNSSQN